VSKIQWKGIFDEDNSGLDLTAQPAWFMSSYKENKYILLMFADKKIVKNINPDIVDIKETMGGGNERTFEIYGKKPGFTARIEVRDPQTNALEKALEVR
jgi:hypothetical protein